MHAAYDPCLLLFTLGEEGTDLPPGTDVLLCLVAFAASVTLLGMAGLGVTALSLLPVVS